MTGRSAAVAFGLATLFCFPLLVPLASPRHLAVYHLQGSASLLFLPVLLYVVIAWLVLLAALLFLRHTPRLRIVLWAAIACLFPWFGVRSLVVEAGGSVPVVVTAVLILAIMLSLALFAYRRREDHRLLLPAVHIAETLFTFVAWSGVLLLVQVLWCFYAARNLTTPAPLHPPLSASLRSPAHPRPRVIWILLDELSYAQAYEHRFPGLALPQFDHLAGEALTLTHVIPVGDWTEAVVPSLMTGLRVENIRSSADGRRLDLNLGPTLGTHPFNPRDSVFADALADGYNTGIAGWYNPYCRILPDVLVRCTWEGHHDISPGGFRTDTPLATKLVAPLRSGIRNAGRFASARYSTAWTDRGAMADHIGEYRQLETDSDALLSDPSIGFLLLHVPTPHPEGIYDRHTSQFRDDGNSSYVDNLVLADRFLHHIETVLAARGEWDTSAVVIMGDHSWRTRQLWRQLPGWTSEDEAASHGGQFDDRPAYLIKLPGEQTGAQVNQPFDAVRTRALFDGILDGQLRSVSDTVAWISHPR